MPLDPSFRARLREAIHQSVKRDQPAPAAPPPGAAPRREGPYYEPVGPDGITPVHEIQRGLVGAEGELAAGHGDAWIADVLGGWWRREEYGVSLVVDRQYDADRLHGDREIGAHAETLGRYQRALSRMIGTPGAAPSLFDAVPASDLWSDRRDAPSDLRTLGPSNPSRSLLFFDLETTGLSGGAGTCAFLMGFGWFEGQRFLTRQYLLSGFGHERAMLRMATDAVQAPADAVQGFSPVSPFVLTTFNGRTFDVPLIENRYLFHRLSSPFDRLDHLDLLHPARRLWRHRPEESEGPRVRGSEGVMRSMGRAPRRGFDFSASAASCALGELERAVLHVRRQGDVPGAEIPARYFHYVRSGDVRPLEPVLTHNRYDLLSLAALTGVVAEMLEEGPRAARNAHECVSLGRFYEREGAASRAADCYEQVVAGELVDGADPAVQGEALRRLARRRRRDGRHDEAAVAWQQLLDLSAAHGAPDVEALYALAVHHEHRTKQFDVARACVERLRTLTSHPRLEQALRHRLERIDRKQGV